MALKSILPVLFSLPPLTIFCQNYGSCESALEVCSKGMLKFKCHRDSLRAEPDNAEDCLGGVFETTWMTWEIVDDGYLSFTITPQFITDDIDFAVYKLDPEQGCQGKKLIRCALSGENVGLPLKMSLPCLGSTGLTTAESEKIKEDIGCDFDKNNFLSALDCKKGERYVLAFQDFSHAKGELLFDFCGSAGLPCDSIFCEELTQRRQRLPLKRSMMFSNRVGGTVLPLFFTGWKRRTAIVTIQDALGVEVLEEKVVLKRAEQAHEMQVGNLPPGSYRASIILGRQAVEGRFVKTK